MLLYFVESNCTELTNTKHSNYRFTGLGVGYLEGWSFVDRYVFLRNQRNHTLDIALRQTHNCGDHEFHSCHIILQHILACHYRHNSRLWRYLPDKNRNKNLFLHLFPLASGSAG